MESFSGKDPLIETVKAAKESGLREAARNGRIEDVKKLARDIKALGGNIDAKDADGKTAAMLAFASNKIDIARFLTEECNAVVTLIYNFVTVTAPVAPVVKRAGLSCNNAVKKDENGKMVYENAVELFLNREIRVVKTSNN